MVTYSGKDVFMFRKLLIIAMFATAAGYCFAAETPLTQVVTSEVYYDQVPQEQNVAPQDQAQNQNAQQQVPVWPLAGSDADVTIGFDSGTAAGSTDGDNIRIVSKIGADLVVENNFNLGRATDGDFNGWSGGANMLHGSQVPAGFDNPCNTGAEMPLLGREMLEDDGGTILSVARSGRQDCNKYRDGYEAFVAKIGLRKAEIAAANAEDYGLFVDADGNVPDLVSEFYYVNDDGDVVNKETGQVELALYVDTDGNVVDRNTGNIVDRTVANIELAVDVDESADAESPINLIDQVRSWVVASGQTLREVLQDWCNKEGWDLVWATSREYPIEASAVFKGRFVDVASALVRNFARATPVPYAKFYKGNRVLVVSTTEE